MASADRHEAAVAQVALDTLIDLLQSTRQLRLGEILVAVVHRLFSEEIQGKKGGARDTAIPLAELRNGRE